MEAAEDAELAVLDSDPVLHQAAPAWPPPRQGQLSSPAMSAAVLPHMVPTPAAAQASARSTAVAPAESGNPAGSPSQL